MKCTRLRLFAFVAAFMCVCITAVAQNLVVKGRVVDSHGESIIGASVVQKNNPKQGVISDLEGNFQLEVSSRNAVIVVSYIGMRTAEVKVQPGKFLKVTLEDDNTALDEVVAFYVCQPQQRHQERGEA